MNREELLKNAKPILFNTQMVQAILEGRKTVTRRKIDRDITNFCDVDVDGTLLDYQNCDGDFINPVDICRYKVGDILYVRESFRYVVIGEVGYEGECVWDDEVIEYKASQNEFEEEYGWCIGELGKWKPSIHMPKEVARIFLKVTNVKVERLQDMTQEDCIKEGCGELSEEQFAEFWNSLLPKYYYDWMSWQGNPYVWVIEFERVKV